MAIIEILSLGIVGYAIHRHRKVSSEAAEVEIKKQTEEARRRSTQCKFDDVISKELCEFILKRNARSIKRIVRVKVNGPVVFCTVRSQSKLTEWNFTIDFNDYGYITGEYWIYTDNHDSSIPERLAQMIQDDLNCWI